MSDASSGMLGNHTGPTLCPCGKEHDNGSNIAMDLDKLYADQHYWQMFSLLIDAIKTIDFWELWQEYHEIFEE